jgi:hypothetical protein
LGSRFSQGSGISQASIGRHHDGPALPAPAHGIEVKWTERSVASTEAGKWFRQLLSKKLGPIESTIHSLKATPLALCAKAGFSPEERLLLGHHASGKKSADTYARDVLASPLRSFDHVLQQIRQGVFQPDMTRSGMLREALREDPKLSTRHQKHPSAMTTTCHHPFHPRAKSFMRSLWLMTLFQANLKPSQLNGTLTWRCSSIAGVMSSTSGLQALGRKGLVAGSI